MTDLAAEAHRRLKDFAEFIDPTARPWRSPRYLWPHWPRCRHINYHLGCDEFEALAAESDGHCGICGVASVALHIDHDHALGWRAVRGMLCHKCNSMLTSVDAGKRQPTPEASQYLSRPWHARAGVTDLGCPDDCFSLSHGRAWLKREAS